MCVVNLNEQNKVNQNEQVFFLLIFLKVSPIVSLNLIKKVKVLALRVVQNLNLIKIKLMRTRHQLRNKPLKLTRKTILPLLFYRNMKIFLLNKNSIILESKKQQI